jgi:hypothetical protein
MLNPWPQAVCLFFACSLLLSWTLLVLLLIADGSCSQANIVQQQRAWKGHS